MSTPSNKTMVLKHHLPLKETRLHGGLTDSTLGQETSKMSLEHFGKSEIKKAVLCQKNLRADLKRLQMSKDGPICALAKVTTTMEWIIVSMFKFISSQLVLKKKKKAKWLSLGGEAGKPTPVKTAKQRKRNSPLACLFYKI